MVQMIKKILKKNTHVYNNGGRLFTKLRIF